MVLIFKETREHMVVLLRISSSAAVTMPADPYVVVGQVNNEEQNKTINGRQKREDECVFK